MINSDQIFTSYVLLLLKEDRRLRDKLLLHPALDLSVAVKVIDNIGSDIRDYPHIHHYVLQKHYRSIVHENKLWYVIEDKLSFEPLFI